MYPNASQVEQEFYVYFSAPGLTSERHYYVSNVVFIPGEGHKDPVYLKSRDAFMADFTRKIERQTDERFSAGDIPSSHAGR